MRILVIGGTGFIGRRLVARLSGGGQHQILVPTRSYGRGRDLQILPSVTLTADDVHDDATLDRRCAAATPPSTWSASCTARPASLMAPISPART